MKLSKRIDLYDKYVHRWHYPDAVAAWDKIKKGISPRVITSKPARPTRKVSVCMAEAFELAKMENNNCPFRKWVFANLTKKKRGLYV